MFCAPMILDIIELIAPFVGCRSLVTLSMADRETRQSVLAVLRGGAFKTMFGAGAKRICVFNKDGKAMMIRNIHEDIFKVCFEGNVFAHSFWHNIPSFAVGNGPKARWVTSERVEVLFSELLYALKPKRVRLNGLRLTYRPRAQVWFELDGSYPVERGQLNVRVFVKCNQMDTIVQARKIFSRFRTAGEKERHDVVLSIGFRCFQF